MQEGVASVEFDYLPVGVLKCCMKTRTVIYSNQYFHELSCFRKADIIGKHMKYVLFNGSEDSNGFKELEKLESERGEKLHVTSEFLQCSKADGTTFLAQISLSFLQFQYLWLLVRDISDQEKIALEEREDSEMRLKHFPGMLYTLIRNVKGEYAYTYASHGSRTVFGLSPEEITSPNGFARVFGKIVDKEAIERDAQESANTLTMFNHTGLASRADVDDSSKVTLWWKKAISQPQKMSDGSIKWHGAAFDITTEMQQREEIEKAQQKVVKAQERAKVAYEFSELLSHEVCNPLSGIDSCSQFIENSIKELQLQLAQARQESLSEISSLIARDAYQIRKCTEYIQQLLETTLDLAKTRSSKIMLKERVAHMKYDILIPTVEMFRKNDKGIAVGANCDADFYVKCDVLRMRQILVNLVSNSLKHTERGNVQITAQRRDSNLIVLSVEDSGAGIPLDQRRKLFIKYYALDSNIGPRGHGIGLALCKELVHLMGGDIKLDETYKDRFFGNGTRIEMQFPFEDIEEQVNVANFQPMITLQLPTNVSVLICDDSKVGQNLITRRLQSFTTEWHFDKCASGEEALKRFEQNAFSMVIMDEYLDDGGKKSFLCAENAILVTSVQILGGKLRGHETIKIMRQQLHLAIPIIGYSANDVRLLQLAAGADKFWRKPLPSNTEMKRDIFEVLQASQQTTENNPSKRFKLETESCKR